MARLGHYAVKTLRFTAWPLLVMLLLYLVSGFAMSGRFGVGKVLPAKPALALHKWLHVPLLIVLPVHAVCAVYFALLRRRWIKRL